MNLISCDEVGRRVLGFTVNGKPMPLEEVQALPPSDLVWASAVELLVWLSRTPGYWGAHATSATFRVWDATLQAVIDLTVPRKGTETPIDRDDLLAA
jgi:hypothetical protein